MTEHDRFGSNEGDPRGQEPDPHTVVMCRSTRPRPRPGVSAAAAVLRVLPHRNPTRTALRSACLAGGWQDALAFASGMAASDITLRRCRPVTRGHPGRRLRRHFPLVDKSSAVVSTHAGASVRCGAVRAAVRPNTKVIWVETPTNPLLGIADIAALAVSRTRPRRGSWWTTPLPRRTCVAAGPRGRRGAALHDQVPRRSLRRVAAP